MPSFRALRPEPGPGDCSLEATRRLIADALARDHFYLEPGQSLILQHCPAAEERWEVFQGRLLDPTCSRERRTFESWDLYHVQDGRASTQPLLSVKLEAAAGRLFVTRAILCHAWEAYDAGDNVILSRETTKWVRELVGTIPLVEFPSLAELQDELIALIFRAVVGLSRLPLTSLEAPLPQFSLGHLGYAYQSKRTASSRGEPVRTPTEWFDRGLGPETAWVEKAKALELVLRAAQADNVEAVARAFADRWSRLGLEAPKALALLRTLFNEAALSPVTRFIDNSLRFVDRLRLVGFLKPIEQADFLCHLLRQTGRHLTAYDLVTFHHRGANYPDALLLDEVLRALAGLAGTYPDLLLDRPDEPAEERHRKRLGRRGLRQGWLLRRRYAGHLVPDAPTSEGENVRVLPAPFARVPKEQITNPERRTRRLFAEAQGWKDLPAALRSWWNAAVGDLRESAEVRELGTALFLDRPLGAAKGAAEPDTTPLLSYVAFSHSLAAGRLAELAPELACFTAREQAAFSAALTNQPALAGIPVPPLQGGRRPDPVSLRDANRIAPDFIVLGATQSSTAAFLERFDWSAIGQRYAAGFLAPERRPTLLRDLPQWQLGPHEVLIFDNALRPRLRLRYDPSAGYRSRAGVETPARGLEATWIAMEEGDTGRLHEYDLRHDPIAVPLAR